tara:strand:- start:446 stop:631 length:186 start_codon:yes stop_codon:yes gene_type:complete
MINVQTADRSTLEIEILFNDDIYAYVGSKQENVEDYLLACSTEELREILTNWVIENNEATC